MTFEQLEENIKKYLLLEDKGIVKLLCATVIANRIDELDPTWLFIVSNSAGGKSELLSALSHADGCWEQDDLTSKTFISGAKRAGVETSLIFRLPVNAIMVVKDMTVLLNKDERESGPVFDQLRMIYDGKFVKSFGTGEDVSATIRMGFIAGVTSAIEDFQAKQASLGQRAITYYMKQPGRLEVTRVGIRSKKDKEKRQMIGKSFREFLEDPQHAVAGKELPDLTDETYEDLVQLAEMATSARSSIKRKQYDREQRIERKDLKEMPTRMAKQLANLGKAMMIMNHGPLTGLDQRILYQLALDSIPSSRKEVMMSATKHGRVTLDGLATAMKLPPDSVKIYVDDLVALDIMEKEHSHGANRFFYFLRDDYRQLISKFEGIEMTNKVLEDEPEPALQQPTEEEQQLIQEIGI